MLHLMGNNLGNLRRLSATYINSQTHTQTHLISAKGKHILHPSLVSCKPTQNIFCLWVNFETRTLINSWHGEAGPSGQCCCGIAGVRLHPAPGWCPERSWQMVLKGCESSYTWQTLASLPVRTQSGRAPAGEDIKLCLKRGEESGTNESVGQSWIRLTHPRQMFQLIMSSAGGLHTNS